MASKLPVWGIDVGQCSLKAIKLQVAGDGKADMLAFDLVEHEKTLSQAKEEAVDTAKKSIETFLSRNDLKGSQVVVAVPGQQTLTRFTKMPPVEKKKIPDMVQYEASQQIPFDMDEVVWDYQVFTEDESPDVEVGIFAIRKELIRNYLMQFTDLGIEPVMVQSSPMASYNAARFERPAEDGKSTILLDMGALATDLIVMEGNRIWSRPVPIGGNRFTEALVSAFKISFSKAEKLKKNAAASKHARQIFQAMRPVLADLVSEIQRSIGFYTSTHREADITKVLGMGNAFRLPGLQKFLSQNLQLDVDKLSTFKNINAIAEKTPEFADNTMSFAVSYGLALQGLGMASVNASLLPLEIRRTILWRKKQPWFAASAACLALAAAAMWVGNVSANAKIQDAIGNIGTISPRPVRSLDEANRIVSTGGSGSALERAAQVAGAAEFLKSEYQKVSNQPTGDIGSLQNMAKLPENNVIVPRMINVIYEAFEAAVPEELKEIKDSRSYAEWAKGRTRAERKEAYLQLLQMQYDEKDPADGLSDVKSIGGPGWLITIHGDATLKDGTPGWLDNALVSRLKALGCKPDQGFYFDVVKLKDVGDRPTEGDLNIGQESSSGGRTEGRGGRASRGGRGRVRPGRVAPGVRGGRVPGIGSGFAESEALGPSALQDYLEKVKTTDLLTDESLTTDQRFTIQIIARKKNTPANLVPDEFKDLSKGDQNTKDTADAPEVDEGRRE